MRSIDLFLNFPVADMNRNVFWRDPTGVRESDIERMNAFWGDETWQSIVYKPEVTLYGTEQRKVNNKTIAEAFRTRLRNVGGFQYVPEPIPMRNSVGATVYYLFFASQKPVADKIIKHLFDKYCERGAK